MYSLNYIFREYDQDYIEKLPTDKKEKYRKRHIRKFLLTAYYNNFKGIKELKDIHMIKNTKDYLKFCIFWTFPLSLIVHFVLFRGIYEIRRYYFNPNSLSIIIKYPISYSLSAIYLLRFWYNYSYTPEIYEIAVKSYNI
jgi:hypothetical protein